MRKSKKAQAVLPFFGLQLASVIVFIIVIISLLTLRRNLILFTNEFNEQTESILQLRRLLSTSDCFAVEEKDMYFYNESGRSLVLTGSRVYPYVLDKSKLTDMQHINCMRKDFYDSTQNADTGVMDISLGIGLASKYQLSIYELDTGSRMSSASAVAYLEKNLTGCALDYECYSKYGESYVCIGGQDWYDSPTNAFNVPFKLPFSVFIGFFPKNGYCLNEDASGDEEQIPRVVKYDYRPVVYNLTAYDSIYNCTDRDPIRTVVPVIIKDGLTAHPALVVVSTCSIKGTSYNGMPFCEKSFKISGVTGCD